MGHEDTTSHVEMPLRQLEQSLIDQFVRSRGYDPLKLEQLPPEELHALLTAASIHASAKLSEIESRSHLLHELHGKIPGPHGTLE